MRKHSSCRFLYFENWTKERWTWTRFFNGNNCGTNWTRTKSAMCMQTRWLLWQVGTQILNKINAKNTFKAVRHNHPFKNLRQAVIKRKLGWRDNGLCLFVEGQQGWDQPGLLWGVPKSGSNGEGLSCVFSNAPVRVMGPKENPLLMFLIF